MHRFHIEVKHGKDLKAHGNIVDHEYEIERDGDKVAEVSKKWFRVRDTYGVEIYDPSLTTMILAITVAVAVTLVAAPFRLHRFHRHFRRRRHRRCRSQLGRVSYVYIIVPPGKRRQFPTTVVCDDTTIAFNIVPTIAN